MSLMKRYDDDVSALRLWAADAASWDEPADRGAVLSAAFRACEELALTYHDPRVVFELLLQELAAAYLAARPAVREREAA
ncbi:hypothetical protein [Streptomyces chattanoogensis]|uniref:hypothetical protein n=1 Tax=Streptomyces chattanoogensis TaxID=66876 RepID=UPI003695208B